MPTTSYGNTGNELPPPIGNWRESVIGWRQIWPGYCSVHPGAPGIQGASAIIVHSALTPEAACIDFFGHHFPTCASELAKMHAVSCCDEINYFDQDEPRIHDDPHADVPCPGCGCGYYVRTNLGAMPFAYTDASATYDTALVATAGATIVHEYGARARQLRILAIIAGSWETVASLELFARQVDVPILHATDTDAVIDLCKQYHLADTPDDLFAHHQSPHVVASGLDPTVMRQALQFNHLNDVLSGKPIPPQRGWR